jgi:hypothetical protein
MESKLNHSSIEIYSTTFAKKVANEFFIQEDIINGYQILNLTSINQVNYFVIKILFQKWKMETGKLHSPYFDYDAKAVQNSLAEFMNVLSQHISVKRDHFEPILKKAVHDSILLIFSPYDFYNKEINNPEKTRVRLSDLKQNYKYIKVNRHLLDALISRFEQDNVEEVYNGEAFDILNEVCENIKETPEDFDPFLEKFSEVYPLLLETIYSDMEDEPVANNRESANVQSSHPNANFVDSFPLSNEKDESKPKEASKSLKLEKPVENKKSSIGDSSLLNKIDSLKKRITINQRFMFVRELFKGNAEEFNQALDKLEALESYDEAIDYLEVNFLNKYNWDVDSDEVIEFMDLLGRRFMKK